jgi:hypothetical protein
MCVFLIGFNQANAQCSVPTPPSYSACGSAGQSALVNSVFINSGATYYYSGASATRSGVTLNGGNIYVCGNLTLTTLTLYSGNIIVEPGGSLTINDNSGGAIQATIVNYGTLVINAATSTTNLSVNATVWNYGTLTASASLTMNSTALYNALATSNMTITGSLTTYAATVNNGIMQIGNTYTFTSTVCLGGGSDIKVPNLFADGGSNKVSVTPNGSNTTAGFTVSNSFNSNSNSLSSSSNVVLCQGTGINTTGGNAGSSQVKPNCTNITLPVSLISFSAQTGTEGACLLEWSTASEHGTKDFDLESSLDGSDFTSLAVLPAHNEASTYSYTTGLKEKTFFRLRINNTDGTYSYSEVVVANYAGENDAASYVRIQPNLVTGNNLEVYTRMTEAEDGKWVVVDMMGRVLFQQQAQLTAGAGNTSVSLPNLNSGMYRLLFLGSKTVVKPVAFTVIH